MTSMITRRRSLSHKKNGYRKISLALKRCVILKLGTYIGTSRDRMRFEVPSIFFVNLANITITKIGNLDRIFPLNIHFYPFSSFLSSV